MLAASPTVHEGELIRIPSGSPMRHDL